MTQPAEAFPPGVFLAEEIAARGWTADDLAARLDYPYGPVKRLLRGTEPLTADKALDLERVLGTTAEFWLNIENTWRLHLAREARE